MFFLKIIFLFYVFSLAVIAGDQQELPEDVFSFVEKRDGCDHFRGEYPYDEERRKFILKNLRQLCTGTDVELAKLKIKYESNTKVLSRLSNYDEDIEANK